MFLHIVQQLTKVILIAYFLLPCREPSAPAKAGGKLVSSIVIPAKAGIQHCHTSESWYPVRLY